MKGNRLESEIVYNFQALEEWGASGCPLSSPPQKLAIKFRALGRKLLSRSNYSCLKNRKKEIRFFIFSVGLQGRNILLIFVMNLVTGNFSYFYYLLK